MEMMRGKLGHGGREVHVARDERSGLTAVVAIHDTTLGPALGGCRCLRYGSLMDAVADAKRLARGMTYKAALAGVPHGGGKSVIALPAGRVDRKELFRTFGHFVNALDGRYITAEDSGTGPADMAFISQVSQYVSGLERRGGDPSPITAQGVLHGMEACVALRYGRATVEGLRVAVQGVGSVGMELCRLLRERGASLVVADRDVKAVRRAVRRYGARPVSPEQILTEPCDVLAPCALGGALTRRNVARLRCAIVAGAANNQLATPDVGELLQRRGVLYAPDYVINAGGLMHVAAHFSGTQPESLSRRIRDIQSTMETVGDRALTAGRATSEVADELAESVLRRAASSLN